MVMPDAVNGSAVLVAVNTQLDQAERVGDRRGCEKARRCGAGLSAGSCVVGVEVAASPSC